MLSPPPHRRVRADRGRLRQRRRRRAAATTTTGRPPRSRRPSRAGGRAGGEGGETVRIAIVAPSAQNDLAFTQSIVDSVNRVGETRDIEVDITDGTFVVEDAAAAIRGYADDGFDLVIAHGSQYGGPLQEIAPDFPDVAFAWGTAADTFGLDNVSSTRCAPTRAATSTASSPPSSPSRTRSAWSADRGRRRQAVRRRLRRRRRRAEPRRHGERQLHRVVQRRRARVRGGQRPRRERLPTSSPAPPRWWSARPASRSRRASRGSARSRTRPRSARTIVVASQVYHWEVVLERDPRQHRGRNARRHGVHRRPRQRRRRDGVQRRVRLADESAPRPTRRSPASPTVRCRPASSDGT